MKDGTFHESGIIPESETITYGQTKKSCKRKRSDTDKREKKLKVRNIRVAKTIGTKTIAGLLALGLALGTPLSVCAEDTGVTVQEQSETVQAKKVDGSEELTDISDKVLEMIQNEEVKLHEETEYLEDVKTGQKVNPETGERVDEIPAPEPTPEPEPTPDPTPTPNPDVQDSGDTDAGKKEGKKDTTQKVTESEQEIQAAQEAAAQDPNAAKSNEELISRQKIVRAPKIVDNYTLAGGNIGEGRRKQFMKYIC